jgi:predicted Zn-dependent peptidase
VSRAPQETLLPNGVRVVTQEVEHARSAAAGLYLLRGSRDEAPREGGLTHLLAHLVFKGTRARVAGGRARSVRDVAEEMDRLGGDLDAWTHREATGFEIEVLPESLPRALDLLSDLVARPALEAEELEREREVVREEIRGVEDDPAEVVDDMWSAWSFPDHPLGRPILGTEEQLDARTAEQLGAFFGERHRGGCLLACAAGRVRHGEVVDALARGLGELAPGRPALGPSAPPPRRGIRTARREHLEQAHVVLSQPGLAAADPRQEVLDLLVVVLGEGSASRLWQRIREEEGLAYDVELASSSYRETGRLVFETSAAPDRLRPILRIVEEESRSLRRTGPGADELERAREYLRTGLVLAWEGAGAHLDALSEGLVVHGRPVPLEERLERLDAVTAEQVHELACLLLGDPRRGLVVLGPPRMPRLTDEDLGPSA